MRQARDTFIHFIADNIGSYYTSSIPVNAVFRSTITPNAGTLQQNSVNISFLQDDLAVSISSQTVLVDVINESELTAVDWSNALWQLLSATFYTPLMDYTNPASPVSQGTNIFWAPTSVGFRPIHSEYYFRYQCRMVLRSHS